MTIAALYVATGGCYFGPPEVDPWDEARDARLYDGPHPVVAHPPCQRWGRYWGGSPTTFPRLIKGDDGGCFAAALASVRRWGGVLEHPEGSAAWDAFGLNAPPRDGGWIAADWMQGWRGWTCYVEQGHYGHMARKGTWLYAMGCELPSLRWGEGEQRLPAYAVERYGRSKASRIGMMATLSSKDPRRSATPLPFRDVLLSIARTASSERIAA
jgi:hypothetical protein